MSQSKALKRIAELVPAAALIVREKYYGRNAPEGAHDLVAMALYIDELEARIDAGQAVLPANITLDESLLDAARTDALVACIRSELAQERERLERYETAGTSAAYTNGKIAAYEGLLRRIESGAI